MAAAAPRRAPAKKTSPRKNAAPKPASRVQTLEQKVDAFAKLRARAAGTTASTVAPPPVEIGPEDGFDPPLIARWPSTIAEETLVYVASDMGKPGVVVQQLLGPEQAVRVAAAFSQYPDGDDLYRGLAKLLMEQFLGSGSGDVPGGTSASSPQ